MKKSNTAILLILRAHLVPYRITKGIVEVQCKNCKDADLPGSEEWVKVPDIVSAQWVTGTLA